ncbi:MAG TPA: ATP-binding protein [Opitutaceae bacterium]|jgi:signal transduction histidine kinase|nr:ATP-binding protein [Opitutaceae bacterium]
MKNFVQVLSIALVSLMIFITAALATELWLQRQGQHLRAEAVAAHQAEPPAASRLIALQQRTLLWLLLLALALFLLTAMAGFLGWLRPQAGALPMSEVKSLSRLAQTSAEQGTALILERDERRRAEADSQFKQTLLGHAQEEKVQLGRDLHDGIIQSLYAAGLTLESARELVHRDPAEAERRLASTLAALNTVIRDVRDYIQGLAPERLQRASFGQALHLLTEGLGAGREAKFDIQIDDEAAALLSTGQVTDALQIAHEAISNGLRHGRATLITLRLRRGEHEVCLLVQDNGAGFDPAARTQAGHGVNNMQARATRLGAELRVSSSPGTGTRVIVNIPVPQAADQTSNAERRTPNAERHSANG